MKNLCDQTLKGNSGASCLMRMKVNLQKNIELPNGNNI